MRAFGEEAERGARPGGGLKDRWNGRDGAAMPWRIARRPEEAVPALLEALRATLTKRSAASAEALGKMGDASSAVVAAWRRFDDKAANVRAEAAEAARAARPEGPSSPAARWKRRPRARSSSSNRRRRKPSKRFAAGVRLWREGRRVGVASGEWRENGRDHERHETVADCCPLITSLFPLSTFFLLPAYS